MNTNTENQTETVAPEPTPEPEPEAPKAETLTLTPPSAPDTAAKPARKGKGKAAKKAAAKAAKKAKGKGKNTGKKTAAKKTKTAATAPRPGSKYRKVFDAMHRKTGITNGGCNELYWPDGNQSAGWRIGAHDWAKQYGLNAFAKREGRKVRLYLRKAGTAGPDGSDPVYITKKAA